LKQTQTDPWQRVIDECRQGDVVRGRITKVVTFGAFAEIVSGVEGLIHISELAEHHVENPREVVQQGEEVNVKVIEIDPERRRLSLSLRRVEAGEPVKTIDIGVPGASTAPVPELGSDEVFGDTPAEAEPASEDEQPEAALELHDSPDEVQAAEPEQEAEAAEPEAEPEATADEPEPQPEPEPEPVPEPAADEAEDAESPEPEADAGPEAAEAGE
jgi:small subunit ribosomal protein S1